MSESEDTIERMRAIRDRNKEHYKTMGKIDHPEDVQRMMEQQGPYSSGKIRNPERIEPICDALAEYWCEHPDLRLGQLIFALSYGPDPFYNEDMRFIDRLDVAFDEDYWVDTDDI